MRGKLTLLMLLCTACNNGEVDVHVSDFGAAQPDDGVVTAPDSGMVADAAPDATTLLRDMAAEPDVAAPQLPGLLAEYFNEYRVPALQRVEVGVDHVWDNGSVDPSVDADFFSARWTGTLRVPAPGTYTFGAMVDDGMRLWVGEELVIDAWTWQFPTAYEATIELSGEDVPIRVEYMERDLTAQISLTWSSAAFAARSLSESDTWTDGIASDEPPPASPYLNPVVPFNCPDPGVARDPDTGVFYAICTGGKFRIRQSHDLVFWQDTGEVVLPDGKPVWAANGGRNWAPELHKVGNKWVVYYTSVNGSNVLSIGAASADSPTGPYVDRGSPLVQRGAGVIDANYFLDDDGKHYLTYKVDGNATGAPTPIYIRELASDGLAFANGSEEVELLRNNGGTWEGGVVEAQWLIKRNDTYFLFYSGNVYDHRYRTGVARASNVTGPYVKRGAPILANNSRWVGPGHGSVLLLGNAYWFVYHAWPALSNGTNDTNEGRNILIDRVRWSNNWPDISNGTPSTTAQTAPVY